MWKKTKKCCKHSADLAVTVDKELESTLHVDNSFPIMEGHQPRIEDQNISQQANIRFLSSQGVAF